MLSSSLHLLLRGVSRFTGFPSNLLFLRQNTCFLHRYPILPRFIREVPHVVHSGGGSPGWLGGVHRLIHIFTWACSLTCQTNSRFQISVRLPLLQGTGEPISADHPWVGLCKGDCNSSFYPPPYL